MFVGDGALRPAVESAVAEMPDRVVYLGRLPYEQVAGVVAHAAVSFVPMVAPERETLFSPLKLYESMACGVPVVASDVVGISEVVSECGVASSFRRATHGLSPRPRTASSAIRSRRAKWAIAGERQRSPVSRGGPARPSARVIDRGRPSLESMR